MGAFKSARLISAVAAAAAAVGFAGAASAAGTCVGYCGVSGPLGDVTAPPNSASYRWISTYTGVDGVGQIPGAGASSGGLYGDGANGSTFTTSAFGAAAGDVLEFYFNFVTSDGHLTDGTNYEDYAWAALQTDTGQHVSYIFTARTEAAGDIIPGQGLPGVNAILSPASVPIIPGAPNWAPLGPAFNNTCWGPGCGYTGWVKSTFTIASAGTYQLALGVTNFVDTAWDTGLAFDGIMIGQTPIDDDEGDHHNNFVPEPATWALMILGFGGAGAALRRRRALAV